MDFLTKPVLSCYHQQKDLLLKKLRAALNTRGIRGFIGLKKQLRLIDTERSGVIGIDGFLQAFDDLKIANIDASDLKMIFGIYETN